MPTIDATLGGASANSYVTRDFVDQHADERLGSTAWAAETNDAEKDRSAIQATRNMDALRWDGVRASSTQALKWPRIGATDDDGVTLPSDSIPNLVARGTAEWAVLLHAASAEGDPSAPSGLEGFEKVKVDAIEVTPRRNAPDSTDVPPSVMAIIAPIVKNFGVTGRLVR